MSLSKKKRFAVFDRDGFQCKYCGRTSCEVVLEVDHVTPVANGGSDDMENLLTSCFDCNRGKSAEILGAVPEVERLRLAQERAELEAANEERRKIAELREEAEQLWINEICNVLRVEEVAIGIVEVAMKLGQEFGSAKVMEWVKIADRTVGLHRFTDFKKYLHGIARRVREREQTEAGA